jgi:hypothetical protein
MPWEKWFILETLTLAARRIHRAMVMQEIFSLASTSSLQRAPEMYKA